MKAFRAPKKTLGDLSAEAAATLVATAADVALVLDEDGVIRDVAFHSEELGVELEGRKAWSGRAWADTVTEESRPKLEAILASAGAKGQPRWRHVNQISARGEVVPVQYAAVKVGASGRIVAVGRDLRPLSTLQQRLVEAQQSLERDYSRLRHAETRYRLLFQMSSEALLVLDAATLKVLEINPGAHRVLAEGARRAAGRGFLELFEPASRAGVDLLLAGVRAVGRADDARATLAGGGPEVAVSASLFRQDEQGLFLIRLAAPPALAEDALPRGRSQLLRLVESAPDALVVTDHAGRVLSANPAFLDMVQLPGEEQARGEMLDRWLGRPGVELEVLMANLRQRGPVRLFATTLRGEHGATTEVELSAVSVLNGGQPCYGFTIRDTGPRVALRGADAADRPRSVEQLTELIGRVPLKELVREATDVIERLCIETALQLTNDNRASAAEMLGLSRQSLYVKLRRYGLGDLDAGTDAREEG